MTVFNVMEKRKKSHFLLSGFLQTSSLQNQTSTSTVTFSPCSSLEVTFFVVIRFPSRAKAFCSSASWPCLDFQHHDCILACQEIARIFDRIHSFLHFLHICTKSTATPTYHWNFVLVVIFSGCKFRNMPW